MLACVQVRPFYFYISSRLRLGVDTRAQSCYFTPWTPKERPLVRERWSFRQQMRLLLDRRTNSSNQS